MRIVDWKRFQGYTKRGPAWIKLHTDLIDQPQFLRLPVVARAVLPVLWITAARLGEDGSLPDDLDLLATLSHCSRIELVEALQALRKAGFIDCDEFVAESATCLSPQTERETEGEREADTYLPTARETPPTNPADRAENVTRDTIHRLQLKLGSKLAALAEHPKSRLMVPDWCRKVTAYTARDGARVRGAPDFRTIMSIDRLEKSIADSDWWLEKLDKAEEPIGA